MELLSTFFFMLCKMTPYLLLGFLISGLMHEFVPASFFRRHLSQENYRSVLIATLIGIPLPLCSCGVIPTGIQMRREGASRGATVAFLVATPQIGVDSIIATYSLLGLPFAICRPLIALLTALGGGVVTARFGKDEITVTRVAEDCQQYESFGKRIIKMLRYAFVEMIQNIGKWLIIGLAVGSLITVFVPDGLFAEMNVPSIITMLAVLVVAIPMYTCSMGSIPIAAAMILKGLSPGTALVLLVAGPAASIASIMVIGKSLGKKQMLFFLGSVVVGSLLGGIAIDALPREWFTLPVSYGIGCCEDSHTNLSLLEIISTTIFIILFIYAFMFKFFQKKEETVAPGCTVYRVEGMSCNHCKASVEKAASVLAGVKSAVADPTKNTLEIDGDVDETLLASAINGLGFEFKGKI